MAPPEKKASVNTHWVEHPAGYEYTKSKHIIKHTLNWLKDKQSFITLVHREYQSRLTFIVDYTEEKVLIDKPKDWPGTHNIIRIAFRNSANLWCHFSGKVIAESTETLYLTFPVELYMLQRRAYFRINLPEGSKASFTHNGKKCKLIVKDLSAGGMLICDTDNIDPPEKGKTINNISIIIPKEDTEKGQESRTLRFRIKAGEIVRSRVNELAHSSYLGIQFISAGPEEERIMKYIRQRELAILRKGVLD